MRFSGLMWPVYTFHFMRLIFIVIFFCNTVQAQSGTGMPVAMEKGTEDATYVPHRVYDSRRKRYTDFEMMLLDLTSQQVVLVGEQHDDPSTHRLERAILEGLGRRRSNIKLSLEMFERDSQDILNKYLSGKVDEQEFLKTSRPWPRYTTDYRPLIEYAKSRQWIVLAGNVPRKYAARVSRNGLGVVQQIPEVERQFIAQDFQCPFDVYYERFAEVMSSHPVAESVKQPDERSDAEIKREIDARRRAMTERFYYAQCIKDETMAESIVRELCPPDSSLAPLIVHFNGSFHSDFGLGTAERVRRRQRGVKTKILSIIPLESLDQIDHDKYRKQGDYLIFTLGVK